MSLTFGEVLFRRLKVVSCGIYIHLVADFFYYSLFPCPWVWLRGLTAPRFLSLTPIPEETEKLKDMTFPQKVLGSTL